MKTRETEVGGWGGGSISVEFFIHNHPSSTVKNTKIQDRRKGDNMHNPKHEIQQKTTAAMLFFYCTFLSPKARRTAGKRNDLTVFYSRHPHTTVSPHKRSHASRYKYDNISPLAARDKNTSSTNAYDPRRKNKDEKRTTRRRRLLPSFLMFNSSRPNGLDPPVARNVSITNSNSVHHPRRHDRFPACALFGCSPSEWGEVQSVVCIKIDTYSETDTLESGKKVETQFERFTHQTMYIYTKQEVIQRGKQSKTQVKGTRSYNESQQRNTSEKAPDGVIAMSPRHTIVHKQPRLSFHAYIEQSHT